MSLQLNSTIKNPSDLLLLTTLPSSSNTSAIFPCDPVCPLEGIQRRSSMDDNSYFRWAKVAIAVTITVVIIASNTVNLMVLYRMREIGDRMKVLLLSLSTSDICLGFFVCVPGVVSGSLGRWPFGAVMCQITGTMNGVAISVSLWSLMAIGIERFLVMKNLKVDRTKKKSPIVWLCVAFIWMFNTLFFALPIAFEADHLYYYYDPDVLTCSFVWKYTWHFMVAKFLYPVLSGTVIVFTSWQVNLVLKKAERARKQWIISTGSRSAQKAKNEEQPKVPQATGTRSRQSSAKEVEENPKFFSAASTERKISVPSHCDRHTGSNPSHNSWLLSSDLTLRTTLPEPPPLKQSLSRLSFQRGTDILAFSQSRVDQGLDKSLSSHLTESNTDDTLWANFVGNSSANTNSISITKDHSRGPSPPTKAEDDVNCLRSPLSEKDLSVHLEAVNDKPLVTHSSVDNTKTQPKSSSENNSCSINRERFASDFSSKTDSYLQRGSKTLAKHKHRYFRAMFKRTGKAGVKDKSSDGSLHHDHTSHRSNESSKKQMTTPVTKSFLRRQSKAKVLLLCATTVFFIATSPYMISSLLEHFIPGLVLPSWLKFIALWTLSTNSLINVFIYSAVYSEFRGHCRQLWQAVTCRSQEKATLQNASGITSSVYELFAVRSKVGSDCSKTPGSAMGSPSGSCTIEGMSVSTENVSQPYSHSSTTLTVSPDVSAISASGFTEDTAHRGKGKTPCHLQLPPTGHSSRRLWPRNPNDVQLGELQALPIACVQQKLQPRDDLGMYPATTSAPLTTTAVTDIPPTSFSIGVSPSISQSTSCSLESFVAEMMPSVDV